MKRIPGTVCSTIALLFIVTTGRRGNHSGPPRSEEDGTSPLNTCTRIDSNVRKVSPCE